MAVIRVEKTSNFTMMSNYHLRDKRLSLKAVGLLSKILSLPPDWDYTVAGLAGICKESKDAIRAALEELEAAGYIIRRQLHKDDGTFGGNEYVVYERPPTVVGKPGNGDTPEMRTVVGKPDNGETPLPGNPSTGNPSTENPAQLSTDRLSTEYNNPPIVPPQGDGSGGQKAKKDKDAPDWKPDRFAAFWKAYPRKKSKQRAISAWDKLRPSDELLVVMAKALKRQMRTTQWQKSKGDYIPYAAKWLNQRLWTDEVELPPDPGPPGGWAEDREVL